MEELHLNPYPNWKIVQDRQGVSEVPADGQPPPTTLPSPGGMSMPMMTQVLIQRFADRRIPTLLDNPYATFETDMSMIRQVQQALGSLIPGSAGISAAMLAQQRLLSPDSEMSNDSNPRNFHDAPRNYESFESPPSSVSPRGYSSSTDSVEILDSSRMREYHTSSVGGDSNSSSVPMEGAFPGEYHSERFQQFLSQNGMSRAEGGSVIKELSAAASMASTNESGSQQTVLRKHSSAGSSLPGTPSSVIRTAPPRQVDSSSTRVILQHSSPNDAQSARAVNCSVMSNTTGWHGGEMQTTATTNGHDLNKCENVITTVASRIQPPGGYNNEHFSDED